MLFVTPELAGFLKAGGLGEVSAFLPRVLREHGSDTRILIPGYPAALAGISNIPEVAELSGVAAIPPCRIAGPWMQDGLAIYFVICPELYERDGTPYAELLDGSSRIATSDSLVFVLPQPKSRAVPPH